MITFLGTGSVREGWRLQGGVLPRFREMVLTGSTFPLGTGRFRGAWRLKGGVQPRFKFGISSATVAWNVRGSSKSGASKSECGLTSGLVLIVRSTCNGMQFGRVKRGASMGECSLASLQEFLSVWPRVLRTRERPEGFGSEETELPWLS